MVGLIPNKMDSESIWVFPFQCSGYEDHNYKARFNENMNMLREMKSLAIEFAKREGVNSADFNYFIYGSFPFVPSH
jgi:hypothetical protein